MLRSLLGFPFSNLQWFRSLFSIWCCPVHVFERRMLYGCIQASQIHIPLGLAAVLICLLLHYLCWIFQCLCKDGRMFLQTIIKRGNTARCACCSLFTTNAKPCWVIIPESKPVLRHRNNVSPTLGYYKVIFMGYWLDREDCLNPLAKEWWQGHCPAQKCSCLCSWVVIRVTFTIASFRLSQLAE